MTISMDKKYRTRDGRDVRLLCVDRENNSELEKSRENITRLAGLLSQVKLGEGGMYIDRQSTNSSRGDEYDWITERDAALAEVNK